jgi:carotenoid cleavage dioxygenase-like enzyme
MSITTRPNDSESAPIKSYIEGGLAPVTEEITTFDLDVTGALPPELEGRYVRIGPNPVDPTPDQHWFTGAGMVHGVRLAGGRAEWYRNRFVRTPAVAQALGEPERPPLRGREGDHGAVNTNVIAIDGRTLALVEAGSAPVVLTDDLDTVGATDFDGTLHTAFAAHPHRDPATGLWHAITYHWPEEAVHHLVVGTDARIGRDVTIDVGDRPMVHDAAITESSVLIFDLPVTFDLDLAMAGAQFPYHWNDARAARVGVLPLTGDAADVRWVSVPQSYVFHVLNAFDLPDGKVVVDVVRWPKVFDRDRLGPSEGPTRLERWTLDPATGTSTQDVIDDRPVEFPRADDRRFGRPQRYGHASFFPSPEPTHAPLVHYDFARGTAEEIDFGPSSATQEFVMVGIDGAGEDEGFLIGFVSDRSEGTTDLVVLAAEDPTAGPLARVHLRARVPDGFHGNWLPDAGSAVSGAVV